MTLSQFENLNFFVPKKTSYTLWYRILDIILKETLEKFRTFVYLFTIYSINISYYLIVNILNKN